MLAHLKIIKIVNWTYSPERSRWTLILDIPLRGQWWSNENGYWWWDRRGIILGYWLRTRKADIPPPIVWKQPIYGDLTKRLFLYAVCSVTPYSQPVKKCWGKTDGWPTSRYSLCPPHSLTSQNMEITFSFCPQDVGIMGSLGHCLIMDQHRLLGNCQ